VAVETVFFVFYMPVFNSVITEGFRNPVHPSTANPKRFWGDDKVGTHSIYAWNLF
jgi:hypothetical protein